MSETTLPETEITVHKNSDSDDVIRLRAELLDLQTIYEKEAKERIQAEKSLWESQRKFKTLLSNLPGMAYRCTFDSNRDMEFLSKGSHQLTGYHSWDLINNPIHSFTQLIDSQDVESAWKAIKEACYSNQPYKVCYRITRADNEQRWVQDQGQAVYSVQDNTIVALEGFVIDITDIRRAQEAQQRINEELENRVEERTVALKQAIEQLQLEIYERHHVEDQLQLSATSLRNAQRIAKLGSWDKNIINDTHTYSDEIFRMLHLSADLISVHDDIWTPHIHPDDIDQVLKQRQYCLEHKEPISIEYKIVIDNDEERFIQERAEITLNEKGEPLNISTTVLDITESKRIQKELIRYRTHLQKLVAAQTIDLIDARDAALAAERAMSAFIANMSHEIRTPLHGILSFANFGLKKVQTAEPEKIEGYFQEIHDSGTTLLELLNDLLDLSKLKAGKMMYDYVPADLVQVVQVTLKEFSALRIEKNLTLSVTAPDKLCGVFDGAKIRQVLRNLLSNAIKFSPDNASLQINVERDGDYLKLTVKDEGPGIPENELLDIFSPFIQSSKTRSKAGGTGLGLAICKEIIESGHGGNIFAENNIDVGATFTMRFLAKPQ